jgi:hypothetical protein
MGTHKLTNLSDGSASTDAINKGQLDAVISSLTNALQFKGSWDPTTDAFPASPSQGDFWIVSGVTPAGDGTGYTLSGVEFNNGDQIIAKVDVVGASAVGDWAKVDNTDLVYSVAGKRGAVTLGISDITSLQTALDNKLDDSQLIDDDTMATATASNIASAESVKAYVDNRIAEQIWNEVPTGGIDGVNVNYTISFAPTPSTSLQFFHQGIRLKSTDDYSLSGNVITMTYAPETGSWLLADYNK